MWPPVLLGLVVWMLLRVRRQLPGRGARWLLYPVLAVLLVAAVGGGYETVRKSLDARAYPMPGQLIDVGGHRLHLHCTGSGSPTVVQEPGGGAASSDLGWIAPAVARDTRVCVYDRAGRGWSDAADGPQDGAHIAADLHTLLDRAHVPGPYVLAGHSVGGLYVLSFAAQFPDQVAGMVLLDSTAPKPGPALPTNTDSKSVVGRVSALLLAVAHLGVGRLPNPFSYGSLPPRSRDETRANSSTARHLSSFIEESRDDELPTTGSPAEPRVDGDSQQAEPGEPPEQVPAGQPLGQHRCPLTDGEVDLAGGSQFLGDLEPGVAAPDDQHRSTGQGLGIAVAGTVDLARRRL